MQLPRKLPDSHEDRLNLGEFYNTYKDRQWFERAEIIDNHPTQMRKTLELLVRYNPLLEAKEILSFTNKFNLALVIETLKTE